MIAWLPHSINPVYAAARMRCLTPMRHLQDRGVNVEIFNAAKADRYQTVVIQGLRCRRSTNDPLTGPGLIDFARAFKKRGGKLIVEDCDNHFYNPKQLPEWTETSQRLRQLLELADHLVASTTAIADLFRQESSSQAPISIIGDGVETAHNLNFEPTWRRALSWRRKREWLRYAQLLGKVLNDKRHGARQLVWFGSHGSNYADGGMRDLLNLRSLLETLAKKQPLSLTVISNNRAQYEKIISPMAIRTRYFDWHRVTFLAALALHDIAVIPITRTPFTVCKSNNRLLLSLSQGLAVCADSIPSYLEFSDMCALDNWAEGLSAYLDSETLRKTHIQAAQDNIQQKWTSHAIADQWQAMFEATT